MINLGNKIKSLSSLEEGIITNIDLWDDEESLSTGNYGVIEIKITNIGESQYLEIGDVEYYSYLGWDKCFKIIG